MKTQFHNKRITVELEKKKEKTKRDLYLCEKEWSLLTQACRLPREASGEGGLNLSRGGGGGTRRAPKAGGSGACSPRRFRNLYGL